MLKSILKKPFAAAMERIASTVAKRLNTQLSRVDAGTQVLLSLLYRDLRDSGRPLPSFEDVGFRAHSQNEEDGILLFLFSVIGAYERKLVDIGAGPPTNSNSANLIINHGWKALLIEGSERGTRLSRKYYNAHPDTNIWPPTILNAWVSTETINALISENGFSGDIDLLSIDLDGIDYWLWKALDCISPKVVIVEYQDIIGPEQSLVVPYRPDFNQHEYVENKSEGNYLGASLPAYVKLAKEKGYRLVGTNRYGFNAFFMRTGVGEDYFPEVDIEECFKHPKVVAGMRDRFPKVAAMEWVEV